MGWQLAGWFGLSVFLSCVAVSGGLWASETAEFSFGTQVYRMSGPRKDPKAMPPDRILEFTVSRRGSYELSLVVHTRDTGSDSVFYQVDDMPFREAHVGFPKRGASHRLGIWKLSAGRHRMSFWTREPGCGLEKLVVKRTRSQMSAFELAGKSGTDVTYVAEAPAAGRYILWLDTRSQKPGPQRQAILNVDGGYDLKRRVLYPDSSANVMPIQGLTFGEQPRHIRIRVDSDLSIRRLMFRPDVVRVPKAAKEYRPTVKPFAGHPRILINSELIPLIKSRLTTICHGEPWSEVKNLATTVFDFNPLPNAEVGWNFNLIRILQCKAFYYLMTGDRRVGREAIELACRYFQRFDFGNSQDVCRRTGEAIFAGAMVYDYCHDLATAEELCLLRERFIAHAETMEIRWPPFRQHVNVGHGNEAQLSRDLLSMALAVYDEDPEPWKYVSYRLLEEFKPMKNFLYGSGKHYEGIAYGNYRHQYDLTAALLLRRGCGYELFEPGVAEVPYFWFYSRTPSGQLLTEGDDYQDFFAPYAGSSEMMLLSNCLWPNDLYLSEYQEYFRESKRQYGNPIYALLMLNPQQQPNPRRDDLPLAKFFGEPKGDMICRTGWEFGLNSNDVVVSMLGAGVFNRSHQHGDAGAFQLFYRGFLTCDIGQYRFFGRPYDMDFSKTSLAHSVMRFLDPQQKMVRGKTATRGIQRGAAFDGPATYDQITRNRENYSRGKTLSWSVNPRAPYLQCDLTDAYARRVKKYVRTMVFLSDAPTALLVYDEFQTSTDEIRPLWQITSFARPQKQGNRLDIRYAPFGFPARLTVTTLLPRMAEQKILTGKDAHTVEGVFYRAPKVNQPHPQASRTEITPADGTNISRFLHVLQPTDGAEPMPVALEERPDGATVRSRDWQVRFRAGQIPTITFCGERKPIPRAPRNTVYLDGKALGQLVNGELDLNALLKAKNIDARDSGKTLTFAGMTLTENSASCQVGPHVVPLQKPVRRTDEGTWFMPPEEAAGLLHSECQRDRWNGCIYLKKLQGKARFVLTTVSEGSNIRWRQLLETGEGSFIAPGTVTATATLLMPETLSAAEIRFAQGDVRKASFKLEVSADGKSFQTVFDGESSGRERGYQRFGFKPRKVIMLKFTFRGNSLNHWNSLTGLRCR